MLRPRFAVLSSLFIALTSAACEPVREVDAAGEVLAPTGMDAQPVLLQFFDLPRSPGGSETEVRSLRLERPGQFTQRLSVSGDKIRVYALADGDGDGACSPGEAWTSVEARILDNDTLEPLTLTLRAHDCPDASP